jgi:hypothetical protein
MRLSWLSRPRRVRYKPLVDIPFVGREGIVEHLQQYLAVVKAGQTRFVALEGPTGSGKSSLLAEFHFVAGRSPDILFARVDTGVGVLAAEFYANLFEALKAQCESVLNKLYNNTKRFRKFISEEWDEKEFSEFLASADWQQYSSTPVPAYIPRARSQSDPLRQLLEVVSRHPWAIASAVALTFLSRPYPSGDHFQQWTAHWRMLLERLAASLQPSGHALVLLIDHPDPLQSDSQTQRRWKSNWQSFVAATQASGFPMLAVWSGSRETLLPLQQAVGDRESLHICRLDEFEDDEQQALQHSLLRALPRAARSRWQTEMQGAFGDSRRPGVLALAAMWTVASLNESAVNVQSWPTTADDAADQLVQNLVLLLRREQAEQGELLMQLLSIFSFWSPAQDFSIDDILPFVDFDRLGLESVSTYAMVERQLGACVRYGLLRHDAFTSKFTTLSGLVQRSLCRAVAEDDATRQSILWRRRLTASVINCLRRRQEELLPALAAQIAALEDSPETNLATYFTLPLCRMLRQSYKDEKYHIAQALGKFPSPLAIAPLVTLLGDDDEQLRSRAAQSLADLDSPDTFAALLKAARDFNSDVRWIAAMALGKKKHPPAVEVLIELLSDEDKEVGRIAAQGLGAQGDVRAVTHLIDATQDRYPLLRESAAQALGELADHRAVPVLQQLCQDQHRQVRQRAEAALAFFSSQHR